MAILFYQEKCPCIDFYELKNKRQQQDLNANLENDKDGIIRTERHAQVQWPLVKLINEGSASENI